jgi:hypothetical protein
MQEFFVSVRKINYLECCKNSFIYFQCAIALIISNWNFETDTSFPMRNTQVQSIDAGK